MRLAAKLIERMLNLAVDEAAIIDRNFKHISFVTNAQGHILSVGTNRSKTHPIMVKLGYPNVELHSEVDAYSKLSFNDKKKSLFLFNFRLNKHNVLRISKPCKYCLPWCIEAFKEIYYTTNDGIEHFTTT